MITLIGDGKFNVSEENKEISGCENNSCTGNYFWKTIANENAFGFENESRNYMLKAWGLNVKQLLEKNEIMMNNIYVDPRTNYRAYIIPGESIHRLGWQVHDQSFYYTLIKQKVLNGEYGNGISVPVGTSFVFGQYWIEKSFIREGKIYSLDSYIKLYYQSKIPIPRFNFQFDSFLFEITSSPWGSGVAMANVFYQKENYIQPNAEIRNFITFDNKDCEINVDGICNA